MLSCGWRLGVAAVQLAVADHAFRLGADVDEHLVLVDAHHGAFDHVAVLEAPDLAFLLVKQLLHRRRLGPGVDDGLVLGLGGGRRSEVLGRQARDGSPAASPAAASAASTGRGHDRLGGTLASGARRRPPRGRDRLGGASTGARRGGLEARPRGGLDSAPWGLGNGLGGGRPRAASTRALARLGNGLTARPRHGRLSVCGRGRRFGAVSPCCGSVK